jgi:hypothetical protein
MPPKGADTVPAARLDPTALVAAFAASDFSHDHRQLVDTAVEDVPAPLMDAHGNYSSPALARVIQAYDAYLEDTDRRGDFDLVLGQVAAGLQRLLQELDLWMEANDEQAGSSVQHSALDGLRAFLGGLEGLRQAADEFDEDAGEDAVDALQDGNNRIMDAFAFLLKRRLASTTQPCPACQADNPRSATQCAGCNLVLSGHETRPPAGIEAESLREVVRPTIPRPLTTPNYQRLEKAVTLWQAGELSNEQLRAELDGVHANMRGHREANRAELEDLEGLTEEEQEVTLRILGAIDEALQGSLAALEQMLRFWDDDDADHLHSGMAELGPPTQRMIEAFLAMQSVNTEEHGDPEA